MTLPSSGPISLSQVNVELGLSATALISMNDSAVRTLFAVGGSGTSISMSQGYGKANQFAFTISSNQTNANLRTLAVNAGWNQSSKVVATINGGVYVSANSTGTPGLTVNGSFPGGVELVNNGFIIGMGGAGGPGLNTGFGPNGTGANGGLALSVSVGISIRNNGTIGGGGGGGGPGGPRSFASGCCTYTSGGGGGGGGQTGATNSSGGAGGSGNSGNGATGGAGTSSGAGGGGLGALNPLGGRAGSGGSGGSWGAGGAAGATNNYVPGGGAGGAGGGAVTGNGNITWLATGTRLGAIS